MNNIHLNNGSQKGFTLVELLLAMAILAVLASLALVVVGDAQDDSRRSDTQSRISLLNSIMETRLENFETIRLPLNLRTYVVISEETILDLRELRRRIVMDIISSEMPRDVADVATENDGGFPGERLSEWLNNNDDRYDAVGLIEDLADQATTPTANRFALRITGNNGAPDANEVDNSLVAQYRTNSEFLYMILQDTETAGTTGLEVLGDRFIGDTDNDGFPEIVDSWGNPIGFQFVMFDEEGARVNNGSGNPMDLDPALNDADHPTIQRGVPASNIRMFMFSTAGAAPDDVLNNGLELITN